MFNSKNFCHNQVIHVALGTTLAVRKNSQNLIKKVVCETPRVFCNCLPIQNIHKDPNGTWFLQKRIRLVYARMKKLYFEELDAECLRSAHVRFMTRLLRR